LELFVVMTQEQDLKLASTSCKRVVDMLQRLIS
jgi:hypothetical protein